MIYFIVRSKIILLLFVFLNGLTFPQNNKVNWSAFDMGYVEMNSDNTFIKSVVGQNFVGVTNQSNTQIISGFLADTLFYTVVVGLKPIDGLPTEFLLHQNYPNPFNPTTTINFELPITSYVTLKVYNLLGQEIITLVNENKTAGKYNVVLDGSQLTSGIYFYRITARDPSLSSKYIFTSTKKILLIK